MPVPLPEPAVGRAELHLVRHGRTVFNQDGLMQGWSDSPLTADGLVQVRALADALAGRRFTAAFSSPSPRAVTTAREILRHHPGVDLACDDGLREMHFGDHEARPEADLFRTLDPVTLFGGVLAGTFPGLPGAAETSAQYLARVGAAFARIEASRTDGSDVLVVGHGVTLLAYVLAVAEPARIPLANATLSVVGVADGLRHLRAVGLDADAVAALDADRV